jgi:hypothetical protein
VVKEEDLKPLLDDIVSFNSGDGLTIFDTLKSFTYIDGSSINSWKLISVVTKILVTKGYTITPEFNFDETSNQKFLIGQNGSGFVFPNVDLDKPAKKIFEAFLNKTNNFSEATSDDLSILGFWMMKEYDKVGNKTDDSKDRKDHINSMPVSYIIYDNGESIRNDNGDNIGDDRVGGRCLMYIENYGSVPSISIMWRDAGGHIVKQHTTKIAGLVRDGLTLKEVPGPSLFDDEF